MPEPQETQQPQGLTQPSLNRYTVSDPNKATPLYVTGMTVSRRKDIRIVFLAFFSGMPLPTGPDQYALHESLVGAFALDPTQAKFLYENLKAFLEEMEEGA